MAYASPARNLDDLLNSVGACVTTRSGKRVHPFNPNPDDIDIFDVAHALSMIGRWGGHASHFMSVAQHSVLVSKQAEKYHPNAGAWGLAHDMTEAFCQDMVKPIKSCFELFEKGEDNAAVIIRRKFKIPFNPAIEKAVHRADRDLAFYESEVLFDNHRLWTEEFEGEHPMGNIYTVDPYFSPQAQPVAKSSFLSHAKHFNFWGTQ